MLLLSPVSLCGPIVPVSQRREKLPPGSSPQSARGVVVVLVVELVKPDAAQSEKRCATKQ